LRLGVLLVLLVPARTGSLLCPIWARPATSRAIPLTPINLLLQLLLLPLYLWLMLPDKQLCKT